MGKITAGEVEYGRTVKTGDYENKKASVKLYVSLEDDEKDLSRVEEAAVEARGMVFAMLGIKPAANAPAITAPAKIVDKPPDMPRGQPEPPPKSEPVVTKKTTTKAEAAAAMNAKDKAKGADVFDEAATANEPDVSDTDITSALNKQMAVLKPIHGDAAGKKMRELIATFVEPPKKSHDIPQNVRQEFLKKLLALS